MSASAVPPTRDRGARRSLVVAVVLALGLLAAACSSSTTTDATTGTSPGSSAPAGGSVVRLVTHDSFNVSDSVLEQFTAETGITVEVLREGDAVAMVNKAILTKDNPEGDVLFGIDNNILTRALDEGLFAPHAAAGVDQVPDDLDLAPGEVTPVDYGDVCLNYDVEYFASRGLAPPTTLADLTTPEYKDLLVVENPATSTPGLAFVLATIATFGEADDAWLAYWSKLRDNGVRVVDGWEQAYVGEFSGGSGEGDRPIVVSYASSPPYEVANAETPPAEAPTKVVESSCFRQIEFAGVLANAQNPAGAAQLVDFLLSPTFQADIPEQMYVYPAVEGVPLPDAFTKYAVVPTGSLTMPPEEIAANRDAWVQAWTTNVLR